MLEHLDSARFFPDAAVIIAGDFNDTPDSVIWQAFEQHSGYTDATSEIGCTFHDFGRRPDAKQIDYIWVRGGLKCSGVEKWAAEENGVYLSDHYPVCAELNWEK